MYQDRVQQVTLTTGTGAYDISGIADEGMLKFNDEFANADTPTYCTVMGDDFELGTGTVNGTTLERTTIERSSNGNNAVNWGAGDKTIFNNVPASVITLLEAHRGATTGNPHNVAATEIADFDTEVSNNSSVVANTAKVTNVAHPLVETAVPVGAVFTDTVYNDTTIQGEVDLNTAKNSYPSADASRLAGTSGTNTGDQDLTSVAAISITKTLTATAANTYAAGEVGYIVSAGTVTKADADAVATASGLMVMATTAIAGGASGVFMIVGEVTATAHGFTVGSPLFLSATAGALTTTAPSTAGQIVRVAGYATDANTIYFRGDSTFVEV
jgi:hypothetical protein